MPFSKRRETRVYAIDRDPDGHCGRRGAGCGVSRPVDTARRTLCRHGSAVVSGSASTAVDGVVLDIGVSSMQLDEAERGFSFAKDGPLDMRMSREGLSAADVVNRAPYAQLTRIIGVLGEEHHARAIARAIEKAREKSPILTTLALGRDRVEGNRRPQGPHPSGDAHIPSPAHPCESRTRRTGGRIGGGGTPVAAGRPARRRHIPFARRPHRQAISCRARRADRRAFAACSGRIGAESELLTASSRAITRRARRRLRGIRGRVRRNCAPRSAPKRRPFRSMRRRWA